MRPPEDATALATSSAEAATREAGCLDGTGRSASARRAWRRARAPLRVSSSRLRAESGRALLVICGLAIATAMLVAVFGTSLLARDRALQRAVDALPSDERSVRVDLVGLPVQQNTARVDRAASRALSGFTSGDPLRVLFFRDFWLDGEFVRLVGLDGLAEHVTLRSGRLPRTCLPRACEVLQIGSRGREELRESGINVRRVGIGELRDPEIYGPAFQHLLEYRAQASLVRTTLLLAPNVRSLERVPPLRYLFGVRSWVAPLDTSALRTWQVEGVLDRESRAQTALHDADPSFALSGPDAALVDVRSRGSVSAERTVLIGGGASALLLVFAMVAAVGLRRGLADERRRLLQRGALGSQVWVGLVGEVAALVAAGWALGVIAGSAAVAILSAAVGLPVGGTLRHTLLDPHALLALALALAAALGVVVAAAVSPVERARRTRVRLLDVAALGAALAVVVGMTRGALDADALGSGGDTTLLLLLPGLVCFAGAVAATRLLRPLTRVAERLARSGSTVVRLALLALGRAPVETVLAAAFLVVAVGIAVFATSYRATLDRGARDEASFAVPLDLTLSQGTGLDLPLDVAPLERYRMLGRDVDAYPILRRSADVAGVGTSALSVTALGIPAGVFERMHWRSDYSPTSKTAIGRTLGAGGPVALRGVELPAEARAVELEARVRGTPLRIDLTVQRRDGRIQTLPLGRAGAGRTTLTARVPRFATRVLALELSLPPVEQLWFLHKANEGRSNRAPSGTLALGPLRTTAASGTRRILERLAGWALHGAAETADPVGADGALAYVFPEVKTFVLRPREPTDGHPLGVLASPDLAALAGPSGLLALNFYAPVVTARIVGVARRVPSVPEDEPFVVADESRLATVLDADAPGTGRPGELWLSVPAGSEKGVDARLRQPPFASLGADFRRQRLDERRDDPLARATSGLLGVVALLALALAAIGLWTALLGALRDERAELFDLEAQGVSPATLRSHLRLRATLLVAFGIGCGLVLGFVLSRLVVSLVQVSLGTNVPDPPLVLDVGWASAALGLAGLVAACALVAEASVRRGFRGETPARAGWSGQ